LEGVLGKFMKSKWFLTGFSIILILAVTGCGMVRKPVYPKYRFEIGKTLGYNISGNADLAVNGGFFTYSGKVSFTADLELTAVETNQNGYLVTMDITNAEVTGSDDRIINNAFYAGLDNIKKIFNSFTISETGKISVTAGQGTNVGMNSYAQVIFPDFSDMDSLSKGIDNSTNFPVWIQAQEYRMVLEKKNGIKSETAEELAVGSQINFMTYTKDDFLKSVEPSSMGTFTLDFEDLFSLDSGKLKQKKGVMKVLFNLPIKDGMLTYMISITGNGEILMVLKENYI
jgi:hypothetical protein